MSVSELIKCNVDLDKGVYRVGLGQLFAENDSKAHEFSISLTSSSGPVDLSGSTIAGYFIRAKDKHTIRAEGSASGNTASLTLPFECYAREGYFSLIIKAESEGHAKAIYWADGYITRSTTDAIIDPGNVIPSLSELLAQIERIEQDIAAANEATSKATASSEAADASAAKADASAQAADEATARANASADSADAATELANAAAGSANTAAEAANAAAGRVDAAIEAAGEASQAAEEARKKQEQERSDAEKLRVEAEKNRATAETGRANAEKTRTTSEEARVKAEAERVKQATENQEIVDKYTEFAAEVEALPPSSDPYARVEQEEKKTTLFLGIPTSNFAYATFWIDLVTRQLMMRVPNGFSAITFAIKNREMVVRING